MAHVLVVDDDADLRDALADVLRAEGHWVDVAKHGRDALERLASGPLPDLVLLDLLMPVMDGWTFLGRLRNSRELARLKVVVMSAGTRGADEAAERNVRYLAKPLCVQSLLECASVARPPTARPPSPVAPAPIVGNWQAA